MILADSLCDGGETGEWGFGVSKRLAPLTKNMLGAGKATGNGTRRQVFAVLKDKRKQQT